MRGTVQTSKPADRVNLLPVSDRHIEGLHASLRECAFGRVPLLQTDVPIIDSPSIDVRALPGNEGIFDISVTTNDDPVMQNRHGAFSSVIQTRPPAPDATSAIENHLWCLKRSDCVESNPLYDGIQIDCFNASLLYNGITASSTAVRNISVYLAPPSRDRVHDTAVNAQCRTRGG
jgi:hypothetical protein